MTIILNGTTGITTPDLTSAAGLDAADLTGTVASARLPAGSILQVQHTQLSAVTSQPITPGQINEINNFFVSITPKSVNSKILLQVSWMGEMTVAAQWNLMFCLKRDETYLGHPVNGARAVGIMPPSITYPVSDDNSSTSNGCVFQYMDTPATTSQINYKVCVATGLGGVTLSTNGVLDYNNVNDSGFEGGMSTITAMEIAG